MLLLIPGPATTRPELRASPGVDLAPWDSRRFADALKARGVPASNVYHTRTPGFHTGRIGAIATAEMTGELAAMDLAMRDIGINKLKGDVL